MAFLLRPYTSNILGSDSRVHAIRLLPHGGKGGPCIAPSLACLPPLALAGGFALACTIWLVVCYSGGRNLDNLVGDGGPTSVGVSPISTSPLPPLAALASTSPLWWGFLHVSGSRHGTIKALAKHTSLRWGFFRHHLRLGQSLRLASQSTPHCGGGFSGP